MREFVETSASSVGVGILSVTVLIDILQIEIDFECIGLLVNYFCTPIPYSVS